MKVKHSSLSSCPKIGEYYTDYIVIGTTAFNPKGLFTVSSTGSNVLEFESAGSGGTYNLEGGLTVSGGTFLNNYDNNGATAEVTVNITGDLTISGTGRYYFGDGNGSASASGYMSSVFLTGNLSITSSNSNSFYCPANNNDGRIYFQGGTGTHTYDCTSTISTAFVTYVIPANNTLTLNSNLPVGSSSSSLFDLIQIYGTLNTGTFGVAVSAGTSSRLEIFAGATVETSNSAGLNAALGASIRTIAAGANYTFNAATTTAFPTTAQVGSFGNPNNVIVNSDITLNRNITVTGTLTLNTGQLSLGDNTLTVTGSIPSISMGTDRTSYIVTNGTGVLTQSLVDGVAKIFPLGLSSPSTYNPISLTANGGSGNFSVLLDNAVGNNPDDPDVIVNTEYNITSAASFTTLSMATQFETANAATNFNFTNPVVIGHFTSGNVWEEKATTFTTPIAGIFVATTTSGFSSLSPFAPGNEAAFQGPLPIELLSFSARPAAASNLIEWSTATETNTSHFVVERSTDGRKWSELQTVQAAGFSVQTNSYRAYDAQPGCLTYYRLRSIDLDGAEEAFSPKTVARECGNFTVGNVFPNPTEDLLTVEFEAAEAGEIVLTVTDMTGRVLLNRTADTEKGLNQVQVDLTKLVPGTYTLAISDGVSTVNRPIIRQ